MIQNIIHIASIRIRNQKKCYLFLKKLDTYRYVWFTNQIENSETETPVWGGTAEEAIFAAHQAWKSNDFSPLLCGFRYTLPERDEVGTSALFHQMVASYTSSSGVYFDEELGCNCIVQNPSIEARLLMTDLQHKEIVH